MKKVCATGPGSAMPVVSMMTRSKSTSPLRRFSARSCSVARRSSRMVQQTQPLLIWMICSCVSATRISLSMFSSPNSFSITAIFWPCVSVSTRLSSVVLPEPRKPVRMVAGMRAMGNLVCSGNGKQVATVQQGCRRRLPGRRRAETSHCAARWGLVQLLQHVLASCMPCGCLPTASRMAGGSLMAAANTLATPQPCMEPVSQSSGLSPSRRWARGCAAS